MLEKLQFDDNLTLGLIEAFELFLLVFVVVISLGGCFQFVFATAGFLQSKELCESFLHLREQSKELLHFREQKQKSFLCPELRI